MPWAMLIGTTVTCSTTCNRPRLTSSATPSTLRCASWKRQQAHINRVRINGNDKLYENVVRRELRTKPGDLFSKEALQRSARELASMGHFDPEAVSPDVKPNYEDGTVDINWNLQSKSNDQVELSLGWGQTGVILRLGLKLNNFSMANLFGKDKKHRGIMPIGDGETLSIARANQR